MFVIGYLLQRVVLNRTLGKDLLPPLLVTFGLSIIIQQGLLLTFTANTPRLQAGALETASLNVAGLSFGAMPVLTFAVAVGVIVALEAMFRYTRLGRIFRATSDRQDVVALMGVDSRNVFALAMGLALAICAVAGVMLGIRTNFAPDAGPQRLLYAFEAVIIGGLGSMWGTLAGGIILGVSQAIGAQIDPGWQLLAGHIVFLAILAVRPEGLFPKVSG
jgi:branched-chain amino acid transport system permease protein